MKKLLVFAIAVLFSATTSAKKSASDLAKETAGTAIGVAALDSMIGKEFAAKCGSQYYVACYIAAGAAVTAVSVLDSSKSANDVGTQLRDGDGDWNGGGPDDQTGGNNNNNNGPTPSEISTAVEEVFEKVKDKGGIDVDLGKGTFKTSDGKSHSLAALGSGQSLMDAGLLTPEQAAEYDKALKEHNANRAKVVSVGVGGGAGGGSSGSSRLRYEYDEDPYASLYNNRKPKAAQTAGLTRTLASGEMIGAQTDNIFDMIKRKYQEKTELKEFVEK